MPAYNLMKRTDRDRMLLDRQGELLAIREGRWPRDLNDQMRWSKGTADFAREMCTAEVSYLQGVSKRIEAGDPSVAGWEI